MRFRVKTLVLSVQLGGSSRKRVARCGNETRLCAPFVVELVDTLAVLSTLAVTVLLQCYCYT